MAYDNPTQYARFEGWWCDNCRETWSRKGDGNCPECATVPLIPATITVDVHREDNGHG